jgi:hypothetical protein
VDRIMELGVATFADLSSGVSPQQRMRDLLEEAQLAEQLGLDDRADPTFERGHRAQLR